MFRSPYYHMNGTIEYVVNTIQRDLEIKLPEIKNPRDLRDAVYDTVGAMVNFTSYFTNLQME